MCAALQFDNNVYPLYTSTHAQSVTSYSDLPVSDWNAVLLRAGRVAVKPSWRRLAQSIVMTGTCGTRSRTLFARPRVWL